MVFLQSDEVVKCIKQAEMVFTEWAHQLTITAVSTHTVLCT